MVHSFKFIRVSRQKYCKVTSGFFHRTIFNLSSRSLRFRSLNIEESAKQKQKIICKSTGWQVRFHPTQKYTDFFLKFVRKLTWALSHLFSWSQSICCQCLRNQGTSRKCSGLLPPVADRHSGKQGATGLAPAAAFLQGTARGAKSSHHPRSNFSTHCRDTSLRTSELVHFQESYSQPPALEADGITRALYPPQPPCNWIRAPAQLLPNPSWGKELLLEHSPAWDWAHTQPRPCSLPGKDTKRLF